jgi:hypothetical protein
LQTFGSDHHAKKINHKERENLERGQTLKEILEFLTLSLSNTEKEKWKSHGAKVLNIKPKEFEQHKETKRPNWQTKE